MRSLHTLMQMGSENSFLILYFPTKDPGYSQKACVKCNVAKKLFHLIHCPSAIYKEILHLT